MSWAESTDSEMLCKVKVCSFENVVFKDWRWHSVLCSN